ALVQLLVSPAPIDGPSVVFRPQPRREPVEVTKEGDVFHIHSRVVEREALRWDLGNQEARRVFWQRLSRVGVARALERAGALPGARVRIGEVELEWE
ncbi:MAG: Obg family GTPase CgtA, partial [Chloroflexota bacterium]|nr:Obg family GTPase CgtA [Chloroflexota bacterium]